RKSRTPTCQPALPRSHFTADGSRVRAATAGGRAWPGPGERLGSRPDGDLRTPWRESSVPAAAGCDPGSEPAFALWPKTSIFKALTSDNVERVRSGLAGKRQVRQSRQYLVAAWGSGRGQGEPE